MHAAPRWWTLVPMRQVRCAAGHHIPERAVIPEFGFLRCGFRGRSTVPSCERWLFVYNFRGGLYLAADVSLAEQRELRECSTPAEVLAALGIDPPNTRAVARTPGEP